MQGSAYNLHANNTGSQIDLLPGAAFGTIVISSGTGHTLNSSIHLHLNTTNAVNVFPNSSLGIAGPISGNGALIKGGTGTLRLRSSDDNTYIGITEVRAGTLELLSGGVAIPGPLIIGETNSTSLATVSLLASEQIDDTSDVSIYEPGILALNAFKETFGPLTLYAGTVSASGGVLSPERIVGVQSGSKFVGSAGSIDGTIVLRSKQTNVLEVIGSSSARMEVQAHLQGGSPNEPITFERRGTGTVYFNASNALYGPLILQGGFSAFENPHGLGANAFPVYVRTNASLYLFQNHVNGKTAILDSGGALESGGEVSWSGPIQLNGDALVYVEDRTPNGKTMTLSGPISGPGGFTKDGPGVLLLNGSAPNTYSGTTRANRGELQLAKQPGPKIMAVSGDLIIGNNGNLQSAYVKCLAMGQIPTNTHLQLENNGVLDLQNFEIELTELNIKDHGTIQGLAGASIYLDGPLKASNTTKDASISIPLHLRSNATEIHVTTAKLQLMGPLLNEGSSSWTKSGKGELVFDSNSDFEMQMKATDGVLSVEGNLPNLSIELDSGAILRGNGSLHQVRLNQGSLQPTPSSTALQVGQLDSMQAGNIRFDFTDVNTFGHLICNQAPNLQNPINLLLNFAFDPAEGQSFLIVRNDSMGPVQGTFLGLSEGQVFNISNTRYWRITYQGNDGNDIVLTRVSSPIAAQLSPPMMVSGGQMQIQAIGTPGAVYLIQARYTVDNSSLWELIGSAQGQPNGLLSFTDLNAPKHAMRFYRFFPQ